MQIEQTLHGYNEGHRLLASSKELPRGPKHAMLSLSDMSGRSMVANFEEYLTGYPVAETDSYAFAKTWHAPEMERPGCVWTHTLLIKCEDIGKFADLSRLRSLFRRPTQRDAKNSWEDYRNPLEVIAWEEVSGSEPVPSEIAGSVLRGLYGNPDESIVLPAQDSRRFEDLVMSLWSQQWPSLRSAFRFCSGSIGNRTAEGKPFDLQVVPLSSLREIRREVPTALILGTGVPESGIEEEWVQYALTDLYGDLHGDLRSYLRDHVNEELDGRGAFEPLVELFVLLHEFPEIEGTFAGLLDSIGKRYSSPGKAAALKRAVVGKGAPVTRLMFPATSDAEILRALAFTNVPEAFDPDELGIEERAQGLWDKDRTGASRLIDDLIHGDHNPLGERLLLSLIQSISIHDAVNIFSSIPGLAAMMVRLTPKVAALPEVWHGPADWQRDLFDAATAGNETSDELQRAIVLGMLCAKSEAVAERAVRKFGNSVVVTVLGWFDESQVSSPWELQEGWRRALATQPSAMLDWVASASGPREVSFALVADLSNPHSKDAHRRGAEIWLRPFRESTTPLAETARVRLRTFLLALGFDNPSAQSDELVVRSFETVHEAAASSRLGYDSWSWLEDQVPTLSWTRNWDKCERLRRGLIDCFTRYEWPISQFFRCSQNEDVLRALLKSCSKTDAGNLLLRKIEKALERKSVSLSSKQYEVVTRYI